MSETFKLYRLQQTDSQIDRIRARLQEIEKTLRNDETLRQAEGKVAQAAQELQDKKKALQRTEQIVSDQRRKIELTEAALYGGKVRNPKELQDLQKESASLKRYLTVLEDNQLEAMLALEEAEAAEKAASVILETSRGDFQQQHFKLSEEQASLLRDLSRLENERLATVSTIPEAEMKLYMLLRQQRRGVAVAKVSGKACSACGSTLNSALLASASTPSQLTRCDTCGRILYAG